MSRFIYKDIPREVLPVVSSEFDPIDWIIPPWCQRAVVLWSSESDPQNAAMRISTDYPDRSATIIVFPCFLTQRSDRRPEMCVHELLHISTSVAVDFASAAIRRLLSNDPGHCETLVTELGEREESMTQDLAWMIARRLEVLPRGA